MQVLSTSRGTDAPDAARTLCAADAYRDCLVRLSGRHPGAPRRADEHEQHPLGHRPARASAVGQRFLRPRGPSAGPTRRLSSSASGIRMPGRRTSGVRRSGMIGTPHRSAGVPQRLRCGQGLAAGVRPLDQLLGEPLDDRCVEAFATCTGASSVHLVRKTLGHRGRASRQARRSSTRRSRPNFCHWRNPIWLSLYSPPTFIASLTLCRSN